MRGEVTRGRGGRGEGEGRVNMVDQGPDKPAAQPAPAQLDLPLTAPPPVTLRCLQRHCSADTNASRALPVYVHRTESIPIRGR
ncbi:hypothetical protein E2C01_012221 [Portunus trituberculatus]|uniref:Uncharacterized protein n=1 Tax=Portunus trituberculatus TaxID=210409 RepID=A0A5B7DD94_PORTR|nr:hypothetical protein [Portunus trituberculatus]